jgi:hypothetical protein
MQHTHRTHRTRARAHLPVREVVQRVHAPLVAGAVVVLVQNPVERRVAHVHVGVRHIDLRAQHHRPLRVLPRLHLLEQPEVFFDGPVAERRVRAVLRDGAARRAHLLERLRVDVRLADLDEVHGELVQFVEVVRGEVEVLRSNAPGG